MKSLKFLVLFSLLASSAFAQGGPPGIPTQVQTQQLTLMPQVPVAPVAMVQFQPSIGGTSTLYYWFVSHDALGNVGAPAGPFLSNNTTVPSASHPATITFTFPAGVASVDILRESSPTVPTGDCNCAVATNVVSAVFSDNVAATAIYTVATSVSQIPLICTNLTGCAGGGGTGSVQVVDVSASPYNVKGDAQIANGTPQAPGSGSCPAGASFGCVVLSAPGFVSGDLGKLIFSYEASDSEVAQPLSSILKIDSSTVTEVSLASTRTGNGNVVWGTDFNSQIQAADAAANSSGKVLSFPCGNYILTGQLANTTGIEGASEFCVNFIPSSSATGWPGGDVLQVISSEYPSGNFTLNGAGGILRHVTGLSELYFSLTDTTISNVRIENAASDAGSQYEIENSHQVVFLNGPRSVTPALQAVGNGCSVFGSDRIVMIDPLCSNQLGPTLMLNGSSATVIDGTIDECSVLAVNGPACTELAASSILQSYGTRFFSAGTVGGAAAVGVDSGSVGYFSGGYMGPFSPTTECGSGLLVASGGAATISGIQLTARDNSTGGACPRAGAAALTNNGTVNDIGGNSYETFGNGTPVKISGTNPVFSTSQPAAVTAGHVVTWAAAGFGALQDGGVSAQSIQSNIVKTLSADVALTSGTPATILSQSVTMPASGCPCRVLVSWAAYVTTNNQTFTFWVSDATNSMASAQTTGTGTNTSGSGASEISPVTYANNAAVTFTLTALDNGTGGTVKAAPVQGSGTNTWMSLSVLTSN